MTGSFAPVTVPLLVEHDRPFAELALTFPDGRRRPAWFWLDTGSGGVRLARELAREVGLPLDAEEELLLDWDGKQLPSISVGDQPLDLHRMVTWVERTEGRGALPGGIPAEGMLGSWVFSRYRCTFDYPERRFTVAPRDHRPGAGVPLQMQVHPRTRFPRVEVEVDGERLGMLLDTGASYTMVSRALVDRWTAAHPDWPRATGAFGTANMRGGALDTENVMLRLPELTWGPFQLAGVGVVSRPAGTFEGWVSDMLPAPAMGALAGNVLKHFRVDLDYDAELASIEQRIEPGAHDMDLAGLIVRPAPDGAAFIDAVADRYAADEFQDIRPGDRLLAVHGTPVTGMRLGPIVALLRGRLGEERTLLLERDGEAFERRLSVLRLL